MDMIDALWYGAVTPGEVLEQADEKQKALVRLMEQPEPICDRDGGCGFLAALGMTETAALHPEAGAILEKLERNQAEPRQGKRRRRGYGFLAMLEMTEKEARLVFRSGFRLGMQLAAEALTNRPELYEE